MSEGHMRYDGPLTVRRSEWLDDWWCIEKAEHEHESGIRWEGRYGSFYASERVSDGDVEGTGAEVRAIAQGILGGEHVGFRRCAARTDGTTWLLWSPRNSRSYGEVPRERAEALARLILETIPETTDD